MILVTASPGKHYWTWYHWQYWDLTLCFYLWQRVPGLSPFLVLYAVIAAFALVARYM